MAPYTIRHWTNAKEYVDYCFGGNGEEGCVNVDAEIFFDDKYHDLVRKFIDNVCPKCKPRDLYMWVETEIDDPMHFANTMSRNMIRKAGIITGERIQQQVLTFIDYSVEFPDEIEQERIGSVELYEIMRASTTTAQPMKSYLRRISFEYEVELEFTLLFTVAPFLSDIHDIPLEPLVFKDISSTILHSYKPMHSRINVMTRDDFARFSESTQLVAHYFPPQLDTFFLPVNTGNDKLYSDFLRQHENQPFFFKKLYVSIQPIGPNVDFRLDGIFKNFELDSVCPMIMYKNSGHVTYKVDKVAIQSVPKTMLQLWVNEPMTRAPEYLMFKVFYGDFFVTLTLYPRLVYHVKLTFKVSQVNHVDIIEERILPYINHVVERVRDLTSVASLAAGITMPALTQEMINHHNIIDVHVTSTLSVTGSKLPTIEQIVGRMALLPGIFFKVENHYGEDARSILTYRYTRSTGYSSAMDIVAYITSNFRLKTRRELVDTIVQAFQIPREQAESMYDSTTGNIDTNNTRLRRVFLGLTIKLWRKNNYDLVMNIKGNKIDDTMASHIVSLVRMLVLSKALPQIAPRAVSDRAEAAKRRLMSQEMLDFNPWDGDEDANDVHPDQGGDEDDDPTDVEEDVPVEEHSPSQHQSSLGGILQRLKKADNELFNYKSDGQNYKSYASLCASNAKRQPIVITEEKLHEIQAKYPKAIPKYAHAGSTEEKRQKNIYICPKVWCTKSEMAMTPEQFKQFGCPDKVNDKALILYRDGQENKSKFISFLDPSRHPKEMCVPCCFFVDHGSKDTGKLRQRFAKCTGAQQQDGVAAAREDTYIKGLVFPLEVGRFGRLPDALAKYMGSSDCHSRVRSEACFVRRGIAHSSQHIIACMADVLGAGSAQDLVARVVSHLRAHEYIALNNGALLRAFVVSGLDMEYFEDFRAWFLGQAEYIKAFNLQHVEAALKRGRAGPGDPDVRREFMVYESLTNFLNYLRADTPKDHHMLMDLLCSKMSWLNPQGINVVVVEDDGTGKLFVVCQRYSPARHDPSKPTVVVLKHKTFFEPVSRVRTVDNAFQEQRTFSQGEVPSIDRLIEHQQKSCAGMVNASARPHSFVPARIAATVCNGGYRGVGILTDKGIFVPSQREFPLTHKDTNVIHVLRLKHHLGDASLQDVLGLMDKMAEHGQFYAAAVAHPNKIGVLMGDGETYLPVLKGGDHDPYMQRYIVDAHIFLNEQISNPAFTFIEQWNMHQAIYQGYKRAVVSNILANDALRNEFEFLRFNLNPFPVATRAEMMTHLMRRALATPPALSQLDVDRMAHAMISHDLSLLVDTEYRQGNNVVFLTSEQVQKGEMANMLEGDTRYGAKLTTAEDLVKDAGIVAAENEVTSESQKVQERMPTMGL